MSIHTQIGVQEPQMLPQGLFQSTTEHQTLFKAYQNTWHKHIFVPNASSVRTEVCAHTASLIVSETLHSFLACHVSAQTPEVSHS